MFKHGKMNSNVLNPSSRTWNGKLQLESVFDERKDYQWAATVLSSRSFPSRLLSANPDDDDPSKSDPILVPILDMLNHRPNHPVTWATSNGTISYISEAAYLPNDEIFNNYGAKGNEECNPRFLG